MTIAQTDKPTPRKPHRLWPGVVAVVLQWLARFGIKAVVPGFKGFALAAQGGLIGAVATVVWWAFLSRAAWSERLGAIALMIVTLGATWSLRHESMEAHAQRSLTLRPLTERRRRISLKRELLHRRFWR